MTVCLLICASFAIAQQAQGQSGSTSPSSSGKEDGQVTNARLSWKVRRRLHVIPAQCAQTYELQGGKEIKLGKYLGQQVEVTGAKRPSMGTTAPSEAGTGSASPVTITVTSIKTAEQKCLGPQFDAK